jgi:hypothetical protein
LGCAVSSAVGAVNLSLTTFLIGIIGRFK